GGAVGIAGAAAAGGDTVVGAVAVAVGVGGVAAARALAAGGDATPIGVGLGIDGLGRVEVGRDAVVVGIDTAFHPVGEAVAVGVVVEPVDAIGSVHIVVAQRGGVGHLLDSEDTVVVIVIVAPVAGPVVVGVRRAL